MKVWVGYTQSTNTLVLTGSLVFTKNTELLENGNVRPTCWWCYFVTWIWTAPGLMAARVRRLGDTRRGTQNHILPTTVTYMIAFDITALVVDRHDVRAQDTVWPQNQTIVDPQAPSADKGGEIHFIVTILCIVFIWSEELIQSWWQKLEEKKEEERIVRKER